MRRARASPVAACLVIVLAMAGLAVASEIESSGGKGDGGGVSSAAKRAFEGEPPSCEAASGSASVAEFEREVISLAPFSDVRANEEGDLVGFSLDVGSEEAFREISRALVDRGWRQIESGSASASSFAKSEGTFRWAFAMAVDVPGGSSVVITCLRFEGRGS